MQKLISTKLVRKIVRSINNNVVYGPSYTDKHKKVDNLRYVTFFVYPYNAEDLAIRLQTILKLAGYTNVVKVTTSKEYNGPFMRGGGGTTYLRINNCVLG